MVMYFDAVLDRDYNVLYNGTAAETAEWLNANAQEDMVVVCGVDLTQLTPSEYLGQVS